MKLLKRILLGIALLLVGAIIFYFPKIERVWKTLSFFDQEVIVQNFIGMDQFGKISEVEKAEHPYHFPKGKPLQLPESFEYNGQIFSPQEYLDSSFTTGFLVIHDDSLVFEEYYLGHSESTPHISWSVAKSFVSALFGIAMEEGHIKSVEQKVEEYLPELKGSGYEGVRIKDVLQMSTGVKFNEDYADLRSDINRWGRYFAWGASQDKFAASLKNERPPGAYNHYVSINTHVLGMIIVRATGKSLTKYLQEKIWNKLGMEYNAFWMVDDYDMEMALGGLNVTLRDYAKMGQLFLQKGNWQGEQIVSSEWIKASVTPDAPHLMPGDNPNSAHEFGYGYQWWIPEGDQGEFMAMGIYNQYIYVNPSTRTVIVKNSANHRYNEPDNPYARSPVVLEMFRAIARSLHEKEQEELLMEQELEEAG